MLPWLAIVQAAFATLSSVFSTISSANIFHGGAANTLSKIGSAFMVVNAVAAGTAQTLTSADVHPDLAAHADAIAATHAETFAATPPDAATVTG